MGPHANDFYHSFCIQDLINQAMLNGDAAGISPSQISDQFMKRRGTPKGIFSNNFQQFFCLGTKTGGGQLLGIF
jgi:hypothetical protein